MLSLQQVIYKQNKAITRLLTIGALCCVALVYAASFSSGVYNEYVYEYEVQVANGPTGFKFKAKASLDILYAAKQTTLDDVQGDGLLVRLRLTEPKFYPLGDNNGQPLGIEPKYAKLYNPEHDLYAHIVTLANGTALVKELHTHESDATTFKNIKKSILLNILPTTHHLVSSHQQQQHHSNKDELLEYISVKPLCVHEHDNAQDQPELFSPDSISQVNIVAKARKLTGGSESTTATSSAGGSIKPVQLPQVFQQVEGQQNVTLRSRVFSQAESNVTTKFSLELVNQIKSTAHERFDQADSLEGALKLLNERQKYSKDSVQLERDRRICSTHHCPRSLGQLFDDYRDQLGDDSMASVDAAVAFLRILDRLRQSAGTSATEILAILKKAANNIGVESSFLDILAAARTRDSIRAALKHLRLPKNRDLDVAERFLSVLSVAAKTSAKMRLARPLQSAYYFTPIEPLRRDTAAKAQLSQLASLEFIAKEFLQMIEQVPAKKWASTKLRWSTLLTLATLVNSYNQENNFSTETDELNVKVDELLARELRECDKSDNSDCRVVIIQAIANVGRLSEAQFEMLERQVIEFGRRESNAAMKVLRDLLQNRSKDKPLARHFYEKLEAFLLKMVYDHSIETTSRVLAAEMIVRFVPNSLVSEELLNELPSFGNNELATMIYSRMQSLKPDSLAKHHENWYWKSCIINGTSTSFVKTMARTESLNASYGVNVELLNRGKMFKESSFDVLLDTKQRTQDLFSLGVFARGMGKLIGGGDGGSGSDSSDSGSADNSADESLMAGMSLKLMGGYLRPYVFFNGYTELMGHYWHGTASEPTTAFNGNLLLIDHEEGYPLVSGFVVEQQMRGVLSIDVAGKIKINLWGKESHSMVTTKASIIVQASQSIFTSYDHLWHSHLFSFGGQALIDFIADVDFAQMPAKTCLQVTQPEFSVRYNSRRHEQAMNADVSRKITRQNYKIGAKSYSLNRDNNKMCAALSDEL